MYETKPELIGIYNNGVKGGGGGTGPTITITIPSATLTTEGCVSTRNEADDNVTSETVNVVPTQWYIQNELSRIDNRLDSTVIVEPISSFVET